MKDIKTTEVKDFLNQHKDFNIFVSNPIKRCFNKINVDDIEFFENGSYYIINIDADEVKLTELKKPDIKVLHVIH